MKYRLSTLLLLIVIAALALGWYVDHRDRNPRGLIGTWRNPTPEEALLGYASTLVIRADGTFTKRQSFRKGSMTFEGKYHVDKSGCVVFRISSKTTTTDVDELIQREPNITTLDDEDHCRCAVDKSGHLLVKQVNLFEKLLEGEETGIHWEGTFVRK